MASIVQHLSLTIFFAFILFVCPAFSADSLESSPSPSPLLQPGDVSPIPATPSPSPALHGSPPAPSPAISNSPLTPHPSDLAPNSPSPAPSTGEDDADSSEDEDSPSPAPAVVGDINHEDQSNAGNLETKDGSSGGMSRGQKAGVTIGVIAAACVVGLGALVYKKRQQNIRRTQYGYAARGEFL